MKKILYFVIAAAALTSCGGPSASEYDTLNAEVESLKASCDSFQMNIRNKNLTEQDLADRQYEISNIQSILHADERGIKSCIMLLKSTESYVRGLPTGELDDETIADLYRHINEINAELKRCARDIASEGTEKPVD